jgi:hypothetical protein
MGYVGIMKNKKHASKLSEMAGTCFQLLTSLVTVTVDLMIYIILYVPNFNTFYESSDGFIVFICWKFPSLVLCTIFNPFTTQLSSPLHNTIFVYILNFFRKKIRCLRKLHYLNGTEYFVVGKADHEGKFHFVLKKYM